MPACNTKFSGGGESPKIQYKSLLKEKRMFGHCQCEENSGDISKLDYESRPNENATDVCRFQELEPNLIFSTKKGHMNCRKPRNPEERTDSAKSEEEAATTIQAVYRGYKARRRFNEIRKSTSDEKQSIRRVAELLAIPYGNKINNPSDPIRISESSVTQNRKDERYQFLTLRKKKGDASSIGRKIPETLDNKLESTKNIGGPECNMCSLHQISDEQMKQSVAENTSKNSTEPCINPKPIKTIKSPAFYCSYDERTSSMSLSDNTDTDDAFSPRINARALTTNVNDSTGNKTVTKSDETRNTQPRSSNCTRPLPQKISSSVLGPDPESYISDNSLFLPNRESVLVFGGVDPHEEYNSIGNTGTNIHRFKPDENIWESVGEIPQARHHHSVAFLKGRVYVVGGADPREDELHRKSIAVETVWSYDPSTQAWFNEPGMLTARKNFGLVVSHGKMYAFGGQNKKGIVLKTVEAFDPSCRNWREMQPMCIARMGAASVKYRDLIWVAGGMTKSKKELFSRDVECYDPMKNLWLKAVSLRTPRCFASLYVLSDCLYLIGGASTTENGAESIDNVDVWDTNTGAWREQAKMSIARHGHTVGSIGDQLLIMGGVTTVFMKSLSSVECFCSEVGKWMKGVSTLLYPISGHASVTLPPANLLAK